MANSLSFDDLIPKPAAKGGANPPLRPQSLPPAVPSLLRDADPRTARVVDPRLNPVTPFAAPDRAAPFGVGGLVARDTGAISFDDLTPRGTPAYQKAIARERAIDQGPLGPRPHGITSQAVAPFMPYVQYAAGAASQGLNNLVRSATGQKVEIPAATAGQAAMDQERAQQGAWAQAHPAQAIAGDLIGGLVIAPTRSGTVVRAGLGAPMAPYAPAAKAATTLGEKAIELGKSVATGTGIGAAYGAAQAPDGHHLEGALRGGAIGAAAPVAFTAASRLASPVLSGAARLANKASGGQLLDPAKRVNSVLSQTLAADFKARGVPTKDIPGAVQKQIQNWAATGSPAPTLMDVAGENTRAAMRTAASQVGPGRTAAQEYADKTAANLQGQAINRTRQLTPHNQAPAEQVLQDLKARRAADAETQYRAPYAAEVDPAPVMDALKGDAAAKGIGRAILESDAMRLRPQTDELRALRQATDMPVSPTQVIPPRDAPNARPVTLGTLDRVKVAYNGLGQDAEANGIGGAAAGYFDRANQIDNYLANLEGPEGALYRKARDNYAMLSGHMDAMKAGDINVANADPDMFNMAMANLTPEQRAYAQVQLRQNLTNAIGSPTEGAVGALNKIATSDNATRNLASMFGEDEGGNYQAAIKNMVGQVNNAKFVAPNTGPKSANVLLDAEAATRPHHLSLDPFDWVMAAKRAGMLLTPQESEMLVRAGQAPASAANIPTMPPRPSMPLNAGAAAGAIANALVPRFFNQDQQLPAQ